MYISMCICVYVCMYVCMMFSGDVKRKHWLALVKSTVFTVMHFRQLLEIILKSNLSQNFHLDTVNCKRFV